jgi:hypothetical protein
MSTNFQIKIFESSLYTATKYKKVNLSMCSIKHHNLKEYEGVEAWLQIFLISSPVVSFKLQLIYLGKSASRNPLKRKSGWPKCRIIKITFQHTNSSIHIYTQKYMYIKSVCHACL